MRVLETERLVLRRFTTEDAEFVLELVNDPAWLQYIGDRGVRTLEDARRYILGGPVDMYGRLGFGLYLIALKPGEVPIGTCGLLRREELDDADIGFALLPAYRRQGYGREAASATMDYARRVLKLERLAAITSPENEPSAKLLEGLGFRFARMIRLAGDATHLRLFLSETTPAGESKERQG